jgi:AmmeMemoRadiSam system protein A
MFTPQSPYTKLAWEVIKRYTLGEDISHLKKSSPPPDLQESLACFVSLHKLDGSLRGCIGTLEPVKDNLQQEIIENAIAAITRDTRFEPLHPEELDELEVSVDVLSRPEPVNGPGELNPQKYGVIVSDGSFRKGLLLPAIEGIESVNRQLEVVKQKAGLRGVDNGALQIYRFTSTRYH